MDMTPPDLPPIALLLEPRSLLVLQGEKYSVRSLILPSFLDASFFLAPVSLTLPFCRRIRTGLAARNQTRLRGRFWSCRGGESRGFERREGEGVGWGEGSWEEGEEGEEA